MNLPRLAGAAVASLALLPAADATADPPPARGTLRVDADGFPSSAGHAYVRLYRPGDDVVGTPWRTVRADIADGKARFEVPELPEGAYAVVVHHDVNDNGRIDHGVVGWPVEPLGFSNGFRLGLFSGKPSFEKLRFAFAAGSAPLAVTVR